MSLMAVGSGMPVNKGVITAIICFVLWIAVLKNAQFSLLYVF
jgi:hypothetical protein